MCKEVRSGFGAGAEGEMWCRKRVDAGPEESNSGKCGWKVSESTED
jgi:hypothetical protein